MADKGQFYGKYRPKANRRANRPDGSPRKVYARTRKEQLGTPIHAYINGNYEELDRQRNATNPTPGRMNQSEATGQLATTWGSLKRRGYAPKAVRDYMKQHNVSSGKARKAIIGLHEISFGADPKQP